MSVAGKNEAECADTRGLASPFPGLCQSGRGAHVLTAAPSTRDTCVDRLTALPTMTLHPVAPPPHLNESFMFYESGKASTVKKNNFKQKIHLLSNTHIFI